MNVHARFYVKQHTRFPNWQESGLSDQFRLSGVQGEPFGPATPSASIDMVIQNKEAAQIFIEALETKRTIDVLFSLAEEE